MFSVGTYCPGFGSRINTIIIHFVRCCMWLLLVALATAKIAIVHADSATGALSEKVDTASTQQQSNTTIFFNGDIITVNEAQGSVEALAIRDGIITAVGSRKEVLAMAGNEDAVILRDLNDKTLLPGLIDAHGHFSYTNRERAVANVASPPTGTVQDIGDILSVLRSFRGEHPAATWLIGWGYDDSLLAEQRHPTRDDLDKLSTAIPILLRHVSAHLMVCNSRCLELAGIDADTTDPQGGHIRRVAGTREPDGVLEEQAMNLVADVLPRLSRETQLELLDSTQQYYAGYGITTIQEGGAGPAEIGLLTDAASRGLLYLDVVAYPYVLYMGDRLGEYPPTQAYSDHFRIGGIKVVLDGSPQGKTAWLSKPYLSPPPGKAADYRGYPTLTDREVYKYIDFAFSTSSQVLVHANGDAAADQMIEAVHDANLKYGAADRRPVMIHAQTVRDDQLEQMAQEGILPSFFVGHTYYWGDWHRDSVLGLERASRISPLRSAADKGLRFTIHNDSPIVPPDMMRMLWSAVNRLTRSGQVLGDSQRATVMEGSKAMTIDAAHQYFEEASKGSLEVGKRADLVILGANPLKIEPRKIKDIQILETIKDGVTVFESKKPSGK